MRMIIDFMTCTECGEIMRGICDYAAREVCEPCGGQAKCSHTEAARKILDEQKEAVA